MSNITVATAKVHLSKPPEQRLVLPNEVGCPGLKERWFGEKPAPSRCSPYVGWR